MSELALSIDVSISVGFRRNMISAYVGIFGSCFVLLRFFSSNLSVILFLIKPLELHIICMNKEDRV